jgi:polysaccharide export outer membrane protein
MLSRNLSHGIVAICLIVGLTTRAAAQQTDYVLGAEDVVSITVWGPGGMSDRFTVEPDGTFIFPLLGRLKAAGFTVRQLEEDLTRLLRDGYFTEPRVTVAVEAHKSQRIYVIGEVKSPGTYSLIRPMTLLEALTLAGSPTSNAGGIALVRRRSDGATHQGPVTQAGNGVTETRADLTALQQGVLTYNPTLRDGDTIAVPRATPVYVSGHVSRPGEYLVGNAATLRQVLSLAGGVSQRGSTGRIKVVRMVEGHEQELKMELDDRIHPGDTVIVPERYF